MRGSLGVHLLTEDASPYFGTVKENCFIRTQYSQPTHHKYSNCNLVGDVPNILRAARLDARFDKIIKMGNVYREDVINLSVDSLHHRYNVR